MSIGIRRARGALALACVGAACACVRAGCDGLWIASGDAAPNGIVRALAARGHEVILGGEFTDVGGVEAAGVAVWDGAGWSAIGNGVTDGRVLALAVMADGTIFAGGDFTVLGGVEASGVAWWDGVAWRALGAGVGGGEVRELLVGPGGMLFVGGSFATAGGAPAEGVARWDGASWSGVGGGVDGPVNAMGLAPDGRVFVGGEFFHAGGAAANGIAAWDGTAWSTWELPAPWHASAFSTLPTWGFVGAGHYRPNGGGAAPQGVLRWESSAWSLIGVVSQVDGLVESAGGGLIVGGRFAAASGLQQPYLARLEGSGPTWEPLGAGVDGAVHAVVAIENGEVLVGGAFLNAGGAPSAHFARWSETGAAWVAREPSDASVTAGGSALFSARVASGYSGVTASWELETGSGTGVFVGLENGLIPGGGGASATVGAVQMGETTLLIGGASVALDGRRVRAVVANACGSGTSASATLHVGPACPGDVNGDGVVNFVDLNAVLSAFGACAGQGGFIAGADFNGDGCVDFVDLNVALSYFGGSC